eukprot:7135586-Ditylum_brightwellii.AAC.1
MKESYEISVLQSWNEDTLTADEYKIIKKGFGNMSEHLLVFAQHCAHDILARWRQALLDSGIDDASDLAPSNCVVTECDKVVIKVVEFIKSSDTQKSSKEDEK